MLPAITVKVGGRSSLKRIVQSQNKATIIKQW